jgi:hypothetical protein
METIMLYLILIVCAMVVFTPAVFAVIDRVSWNMHIKQLKQTNDTRVKCITCHNYKPQSEMYFLDQCFNCYDIIVGIPQNGEHNG